MPATRTSRSRARRGAARPCRAPTTRRSSAIPVAVLGLAGYLAIFATALFRGELARVVGAGLALGGLIFSLYLILVQVFAIEAFCQWCLASDAVMLVLTVAALARVRTSG